MGNEETFEQVIEFWDNQCLGWAGYPLLNELREIVLKNVERICGNPIPNADYTILDVLCGNVTALNVPDAYLLAARKIILVDGSPVMLQSNIEKLQEYYAKANRKFPEFETHRVNARVDGLPVEPGTVDLVYSGFGARYWGKNDVVVQDMARSLKPNGLFVLFEFTDQVKGGVVGETDFDRDGLVRVLNQHDVSISCASYCETIKEILVYSGRKR